MTTGGLSIEIEPLAIGQAVVVLTTSPEETMSITLSLASVVVTPKEAEVPTYQRFVTPGILTVI